MKPRLTVDVNRALKQAFWIAVGTAFTLVAIQHQTPAQLCFRFAEAFSGAFAGAALIDAWRSRRNARKLPISTSR
jgi:hypothetical protein